MNGTLNSTMRPRASACFIRRSSKLVTGSTSASRPVGDVATVPPSIIRQLYKPPLTDKGLDAFIPDWAKTGQKIG